MSGALVAGLDVGTTRVKLRVYDESYNVVYSRDERSPLVIDGPRAVHDAEKLYSIVRDLASEAVNRGVKCLGIATYRGSLVVWDRTGQPLYGVATWMDRRSEEGYSRLPILARILSRAPVIGGALKPEAPIVRLAVALREDPSLARMLSRGDALAWNVDAYLVYRLTGRHASDASNSALTGLIHPGTLEPMWFLARILRIPRFRVPDILGHDELAGEFRGAEVGAPIGDQQASSHALGCMERGCLRITLGTGLFLDYSTGGELVMRAGQGFIPVILEYSRDRRVYGVEIYASGVGTAVERLVEESLDGDYGMLSAGLEPQGRPPLVNLLPWGLRRPRIPGSGRVQLARGDPRSIAAGIAHSLAAVVGYHYREMERSIGRPSRVVLTGGLSRAPGVPELIASYIGRPLEVYPDPGSAALGAALIAARACGLRLGSPSPAMRVAEPDPDLVLIELEAVVELARERGGGP